MPYRSERQRKYLHAREPALAERWDAKYGGRIVPKAKAKRPRRAGAAVEAIRRKIRG